MNDATTELLKHVIESQHGGTATYAHSVHVQDADNVHTHWDGIVHVFNLKDHPDAKRVYAWTSIIQGTESNRYFAVLHQRPVTDPIQAVRAATGAIRNQRANEASD